MPSHTRLMHLDYPELWNCFAEIPWWHEVEKLIGYDYKKCKISFDSYIIENEHLHEEWILKIKLKML